MTMSSSEVVPSVMLGVTNDAYAVVPEDDGYVLSNDTQISAVGEEVDDMMINQNTYNIEKSNGVVIGPVSHFHCPVTIIQKCQEPTDHKTTHDKECTKDVAGSHCHGNQSPSARRRSTSKSTNQKLLDAVIRIKHAKKVPLVLLGVGLAAGIFIIAFVIVYASEDQAAYLNNNVQIPKDDSDNDHEPNLNATEPQLIPRKFWGARPPLSVRPLKTPVLYFLVAHTGGGNSCDSVAECSSILQSLQSYAVANKSPDIGYNFLIGGDGNIYVGRDWDAINYLQNYCISVAFIGDYTYDTFTPKMQQALKDLIQMGIDKKKLRKDYVLLSHSQTWSSISPGENIRSVIKTWPHYYPKDYIDLSDD